MSGQLTGAAVRDIRWLAWKDSLAWAETMNGSQWERLLQREKRFFDSVLSTVPDTEIAALQNELTLSYQGDEGAPFQTLGLHIVGCGGHHQRWSRGDEKETECVDVVCDTQNNVWDVTDVGEGAETYEVRFWPHDSNRPEWRVSGVGPFVVVLGSLCFFLKAQNNLWYSELVCVDAKTGKSPKILYTETDRQWNLSLVRCENRSAYCVRENSGLQEVFSLSAAGTLQKLLLRTECVGTSHCSAGFFVLGGDSNCLATVGRGTDDWKAYGSVLKHWRLPSWHQAGVPETVIASRGLLVTRKQGVRLLWNCSSKHEPQRLYSVLGELRFNMENCFHNEPNLQVRILKPGAFSQQLTIAAAATIREETAILPPYGTAVRLFTTTHVPYILVKPLTRTVPLRHLLVIGYGAYGLPTALSTTRWIPLLSRGWAIVFALVRGGGDDTQEWADSARRWRRENAIHDFLEVIRAAQKETAIPAQNTCVYGRSAGGILIGAAVATKDRPFQMVYGEVPYLDVLRTTTNPELPLTQLEYDEFGNPAMRLEDLAAIARFSPMEAIPFGGYPGCFILIRTGENDSEVFAYEPVKWIVRTRGARFKDTTKILAFEAGEGHFVGGDTLMETQATDLAILLTHTARKKSHGEV